MASNRINYRQDLPPKGGYASFNVERMKAPIIAGRKLWIIMPLTTVIGGYLNYRYNHVEKHKREVEMRSARNAITPLIMAERDRQVLKQLRYNREEEADLMKDYPTWEVGTFFGEKIYKTFDDDVYVEPSFYEYFAHVLDKANTRIFGELFS